MACSRPCLSAQGSVAFVSCGAASCQDVGKKVIFWCAGKSRDVIFAKKAETRRDQRPKKYPRWDPSKKAQDSFKKLPRGDTFLREDDVLRTKQNGRAQDVCLREDQAVGQVVAAQANIMRVVAERADAENGKQGSVLLCYVRAVLKKIKKRVLVGDKVLVSGIDWISKRGMVEDVLDRQTEILDPPVANVDHLVVLFALDRPKLDPVALSRFLVEAESMQIPFTLVLNKADLVEEDAVESWRQRLSGWGYDAIFCSVNEKKGLSSLARILRPRTSVVVGPSGVGKSSLINAMGTRLGFTSLPAHVELGSTAEQLAACERTEESEAPDGELLAASEVSERSGRGRHTTRNVTLLELANGGGRIVDTPGFSQPSLGKLTISSVADCFPEITALLAAHEPGGCGFADCLHAGEPNCVVGAAWDRSPYYLGLLEEVKKREELQKRVLGTKHEGNVRYKTGTMGVLHAEPRLVSSKHRRESRKKSTQSVAGDVWEQNQDQEEIDEITFM